MLVIKPSSKVFVADAMKMAIEFSKCSRQNVVFRSRNYKDLVINPTSTKASLFMQSKGLN